LADPRVAVRVADVAEILQSNKERYDAIILDVDNGPDGLTRLENTRLYRANGLKAIFRNLTKGGVLAVWSAAPDGAFTMRLRQAGFQVEERPSAAGNRRKGGRHTIWLAVRR
jgi:spermidine synthase